MTVLDRSTSINGSVAAQESLTIPQALERIGKAAFSEQAASDYKRQKLEEVWRNSGFGGTFLAKHPDLFYNRGWTMMKASAAVIVIDVAGMLCKSSPHISAGQTAAKILIAVAASLLFGSSIYLYHVSKLGYAGAIGSDWKQEGFDGVAPPLELPARGRQLCQQIAEMVPRAQFYIEQLQTDPFIGAWEPGKSGRTRFYGWNGSLELVEVDGKILEMPML